MDKIKRQVSKRLLLLSALFFLLMQADGQKAAAQSVPGISSFVDQMKKAQLPTNNSFHKDNSFSSMMDFSNCQWKHPPVSIKSSSVCADPNKKDKNVCSGVITCDVSYIDQRHYGLPPVILDNFEISAACGTDANGACLAPGLCGAASLNLDNPSYRNEEGDLLNGTEVNKADVERQGMWGNSNKDATKAQ